MEVKFAVFLFFPQLPTVEGAIWTTLCFIFKRGKISKRVGIL